MQISFIYPKDSANELIESVEDLNSSIGNENLISSPVRALGLAVRYGLFIAYIFLAWFILKALTYRVTARGEGVIIPSLLVYVLVFIAGIYGIYRLGFFLRKKILELLKADEAEESYSFSQYVTRKDPLKKKQKSLTLYQMCDTLKQSTILDATARSDGDMCKVEVNWQSDKERSVYVFKFPYKINAGSDQIIVDFERELVLLPDIKDLEE